ncbi:MULTISPECIES: YtxH domain-containing protein [unclassified Paenibacillus]|uniref:YtxH domain-containing protein n=1 Tax=unclassified Paenibacillus TaxID=185978 RepID=UPI00069326B8|nr:YtxH domain-containing protein [Paenibacillus sp. FSL H7-0737]
MKKDTKGLLWGALVGSVVGSVTALLFAPKPGKELRKDIAEGTAAGIEKVQGIAVQAGDKSVELYDKAKDSIGHVVHEVREWSKSCSNAVEEDTATVAVSGIATEETIQEAAATLEEVTELEVSPVNEEVSSEEASLEEAQLDDKDNNEIA